MRRRWVAAATDQVICPPNYTHAWALGSGHWARGVWWAAPLGGWWWGVGIVESNLRRHPTLARHQGISVSPTKHVPCPQQQQDQGPLWFKLTRRIRGVGDGRSRMFELWAPVLSTMSTMTPGNGMRGWRHGGVMCECSMHDLPCCAPWHNWPIEGWDSSLDARLVAAVGPNQEVCLERKRR